MIYYTMDYHKYPPLKSGFFRRRERERRAIMMDIVLPGTGGTTPRVDRHLSSAYLRHNGAGILIDCGEGTQIAIKKAGFSIAKIGLILLTHFHADHVSGLPGLLLTMGNEGRRDKVKICGPAGVAEIVKALTIIAPELPFSIECVPMSDFESFSWQGVDITAFEVHHTCTCFGYDFRLRRSGKFDKEKAEKNGVPMRLWRLLQNGQTIEEDGVRYEPSMVLGESRRGLHVTYATDTRPCEIISTMADEADLLILNPGSLGEPRRLEGPSYAVVYLELDRHPEYCFGYYKKSEDTVLQFLRKRNHKKDLN